MKRWYQEQNYWLLIFHMGLHCQQFLPKSFSKVILFLLSFLMMEDVLGPLEHKSLSVFCTPPPFLLPFNFFSESSLLLTQIFTLWITLASLLDPLCNFYQGLPSLIVLSLRKRLPFTLSQQARGRKAWESWWNKDTNTSICSLPYFHEYGIAMCIRKKHLYPQCIKKARRGNGLRFLCFGSHSYWDQEGGFRTKF